MPLFLGDAVWNQTGKGAPKFRKVLEGFKSKKFGPLYWTMRGKQFASCSCHGVFNAGSSFISFIDFHRH